jgi:site-specific recombinase XerD
MLVNGVMLRGGPRPSSTPSASSIRSFFKYAHQAGLLSDNPVADIALSKIRMGEIRALSQDECGRLLLVGDTNQSPFRKINIGVN